MIPTGVQVFVALEPIDLRAGFERLSGLARDRIGYDARSGALFIFVGRRRATLKLLFFDGTGMCVFHKKLDRGRFSVPSAAEGATHVEIDDVVFEALLDGIDLAMPSPTPPRKPRRRIH